MCVCVCVCVCVLLDISPLPASTVPTPAYHFVTEALPSTAAAPAQQTIADTPRKLIDTAEVKTFFISMTPVLALDLDRVHDVKLHHPSSSVATSNQ